MKLPFCVPVCIELQCVCVHEVAFLRVCVHNTAGKEDVPDLPPLPSLNNNSTAAFLRVCVHETAFLCVRVHKTAGKENVPDSLPFLH